MTTPIVFVVDDDPSVRRSIIRVLKSIQMEAEGFPTAEAFLKHPIPKDRPSCVIIDVRMPGLSGLDLQKELIRRAGVVSAIFISGNAAHPVTLEAMKWGAVDFLAKPFDSDMLIAAVRQALLQNSRVRVRLDQRESVRDRVARLTPREREIFFLLTKGLLNKQVARMLGRSEKTIKVHRARVMRKMSAESFAELVRMSDKAIEGDRRTLTEKAEPALN